MVHAENATLQQGVETFDAVGGHVATGKLAGAVVDALVFEGRLQPVVDHGFVSVKRGSHFNACADLSVNRCAVHRGHGESNRATAFATFTQGQDGGLAYCTPALVELLALVLVLLFASHVGLVHLDDALKLPGRFTALTWLVRYERMPS